MGHIRKLQRKENVVNTTRNIDYPGKKPLSMEKHSSLFCIDEEKKFYNTDASLPTSFARGSCQGRRRTMRPTQPMRPTTPTTTTPSSSKPSDRYVSFLMVASTSRNAGSENLDSRRRKYLST